MITRTYILIEDQDKILTVYNSKHDFWGLPGGHREEGETDLETLNRELKEEVGLEVKNIELLGEIRDRENESIALYRTKDFKKVEQMPDKDETISEFKFVEKEKLKGVLSPKILEVFKKYI